jgi:cytochrome c peroxidase
VFNNLKIWSFLSLAALVSCQSDPGEAVIPTDFNGPTPANLEIPDRFPPMPVNPDNPLTVEGIELGRKLFYDPILSGNNQQSCASCHHQNAAFVDPNVKFSRGITGALGIRNSMPLFNMAWAQRFFWDGNAKNLEELIVKPIINEFEMNEDVVTAVKEVQNKPEYPPMFKKAFGTEQVSMDLISKAMAQFLKTIISSNPKSDGTARGRVFRTPQEQRGLMVFLDEEKGDCFHCHEVGNPFVTNFQMVNNGGINNPAGDKGFYGVTGDPRHLHQFKVPSLLNLKYTAPYFHDGRFNTLEEVLDFYDTGFVYHENLDPNLKKHMDFSQNPPVPIPRTWTQQDKQDLLAFLLSLSDTTLLRKEEYGPY